MKTTIDNEGLQCVIARVKELTPLFNELLNGIHVIADHKYHNNLATVKQVYTVMQQF